MRNATLGPLQLLALSTILAACSSPPIPGTADTPRGLLIENVTVISPEREHPLYNASVLIEGSRITRIGPSDEVLAPRGAGILRAEGKFLIPGLIDSHVHLSSVPGVNVEEFADKGLLARYFAQLPRSYLYFGYTTLVDLAVAAPEVLAEFRARPMHPDVYDCAGPLPVANGYPMAFAPREARFRRMGNFLYDPTQASGIPAEFRPADHTPEAAVARVKAAGGICVKTYWEKGFGKKMKFPVPSDATLKRVTRAARSTGLVSMIHANSLEAQEHAVRTDFDVIAHGMWNWGELSGEPELPLRIKKVLDQVLARKIGYMPTIQVIGGTQALADPEFLRDPRLRKVLPGGLVDYYGSEPGQWFRKLLERDEETTLTMQTDEPALSRIGRVTRYLADRQANLLFGTDTPSSPTYGNPPGLNGFLEMKRWISNGVSPAQLFYAATLGNARALKLDASVGTIEVGKTAHLLILERNPLETVDAYDSIDTVVLSGRTIPRKDLRAR